MHRRASLAKGVHNYWKISIPATLLVVALFWAFSWHNYAELKRQRTTLAVDDAQKVAMSFDEHANRLFQLSESHIRAIREYYLEKGGGDALRQFVEASRSSVGSKDPVTIVNAEGDVVFHSDPQGQAFPSLGSTEYFAYFKQHPEDRLYIGPARRGLLTRQMNFRVALPILRDGRFDGVILKTLRPDDIARFYAGFNMGPHSSMTILTIGHRIISRQPMPSDEALVQPLDNSLLWGELQRHPFGSYEQRAMLDGERRIYAYRKLENYPVVVTLGISRADIWDALADARLTAIMQGLAFTLAAVGFCALFMAMDRRAQGLARAEAKSRRATALLEAKAQELMRSNAELEQFAYVASHDLRQPLRQIGGYVALLDRKWSASLDPETREFINFAREGVCRMDRLIVDLLEYSRIGRSRRPPGPVVLADVLAEARANLSVAIDDAKAVVSFDLAGDLLPLWGERGELVRLFQNLLGNAIKYRDPARPPQVSVLARMGLAEDIAQAGPMVEVVIRDNGIGIAPEHFDRIFGVFQRLHPDAAYEGTGIGLSICKKVVEHHKGRIWVESKVHEGSSFHLLLPAATPADQA